MLSAGSVRAKNAKNIILLNLLDACFGCFAWYATGYAFAFGDPTISTDGTTYPWHNPFIGHKYFFQVGMPRADLAKWFFQFTFAATSATIVSGALAERCRFEAYICYNLILVAFVYPVVAHWVWSPFGWMSALRTTNTSSSGYTLLFGTGVYDFAGDGPVHMVGGFASLVGAWVLGPRIGRFDAEGTPVDMPGHNASLTLLGVFLLWFGWFGFNPGSTNAILMPTSDPAAFVPGFSSISAAIAVNTTVSAAAATISTLLVAMIHTYYSLRVVVWDLIIAGNGALAGLVAITGPCAFVNTWAAWIIGLVAGALYYAASKIILFKMQVDDPLDAIAVHAVSGMWGMIAGALFSASNLVSDWYGPVPGSVSTGTSSSTEGYGQRPYGLFMGGGGALLGAHLIYILVIAVWTMGIMYPFFLILYKSGIMRVPPEVEAAGLDVSYHGGSSYPGHHEDIGMAGSNCNTTRGALGGGGIGGGGGSGNGVVHRGGDLSKSDAEAQSLLMSRAIEEALKEVEKRGWQPPLTGKMVQEVIGGGGGGDVSNSGVDGGAVGSGMPTSQSLADIRAAVQQNYKRNSPGGDGSGSAAMSPKASMSLPEDAAVL
jgi:ammonium transporter, Amt family